MVVRCLTKMKLQAALRAAMKAKNPGFVPLLELQCVGKNMIHSEGLEIHPEIDEVFKSSE